MELDLKRADATPARTIGELAIDGRFTCFTLEDALRLTKVPGDTAIPAGRYRVTVTLSGRFHRLMPLVNEVPGFDGIRIHSGNTAADTRGCILLGMSRAADRVVDSRMAFGIVYPQIVAALGRHEEVWITVENPPMDQTPWLQAA